MCVHLQTINNLMICLIHIPKAYGLIFTTWSIFLVYNSAYQIPFTYVYLALEMKLWLVILMFLCMMLREGYHLVYELNPKQ